MLGLFDFFLLVNFREKIVLFILGGFVLMMIDRQDQDVASFVSLEIWFEKWVLPKS